jgi:hypothetical protein
VTSKTPDEIALMSPEERAAWRAEEDMHVFGAGFRRDRNGKPIEQGLGSIDNPTENSFRAIEKFEGKAAADAARQRANKRAGVERW